MPDCSRIDPLVTPFVDGELPQDEQQTLTRHITACPACRGKVLAERAIRSVMQARRAELSGPPAPAALKARCARLDSRPVLADPSIRSKSPRVPFLRASAWRTRVAPFALAATLLLVVGGAFIYQATRSSSRVLAAELTMDHEKCFRLNRLLGTHHSPEAVEASMASGFDWNVQLPHEGGQGELNLVGSRPCLSGEGKVAHIMYTYNGQPVSLFMLPRETRASELVQVFGHRARIWSEGGRTFVLVARESASEMEHMAALVRTTIR
jgi:anti-sigma factor RsiW